ncbi:hypothetical protein PoB_000218700 [Plakobranchus ocellatus]|uniref:Uncharacterized protein n=1 Tax=Plakobranchus ocellatus TaxID=259542 RepID=A0AAV3Y0P8_9GAST|nr:hypothetical protein PoB_000218700 [Plakobranchus ocellatus]
MITSPLLDIDMQRYIRSANQRKRKLWQRRAPESVEAWLGSVVFFPGLSPRHSLLNSYILWHRLTCLGSPLRFSRAMPHATSVRGGYWF